MYTIATEKAVVYIYYLCIHARFEFVEEGKYFKYKKNLQGHYMSLVMQYIYIKNSLYH